MRFDLDPTGATSVLADGRELLVHGSSGESRFRRAFPAELVAVAVAGPRVVGVDEAGHLEWLDARSGEVAAEVELGASPLAMAASRDGIVAVALPDVVVLRSVTGEVARLPYAEASLVAWSPGGTLALAVGSDVVLVDRDGHERRREGMSYVVTGLCRIRAGSWAVAVGLRVMELPDDGPVAHLTHAPDGLAVADLASNGTGDRLALQLGDQQVVVLAWPSREPAGQVRVIDGHVCGLAFGPARWLGIGLEGGAANRVDLITGETWRTDPHVTLSVTPEPVVEEVEVTEPTEVAPRAARAPATRPASRAVPAVPPALVWALAAAVAVGVGLVLVVVVGLFVL